MTEPPERFWEVFFEVYELLPRQGPGSRACAGRALDLCAGLFLDLYGGFKGIHVKRVYYAWNAFPHEGVRLRIYFYLSGIRHLLNTYNYIQSVLSSGISNKRIYTLKRLLLYDIPPDR